jgi:hypothetical protein
VILAALAWGGLIAASSSTVILPHDFFAWLAAHVLRDEASLRRFAAFWGYSWFAIVKGWHAAEFAILFLLVFWIFDRLRPEASRRNLAVAAILAALFAMSDEYHQTFVPGRGGTWKDVGIDCLGIGLAGALVWLRRTQWLNGPPRPNKPGSSQENSTTV